MGKAKEIAELGDKITVSGGTVTVADISTSTFSGTSIHSMQDVDLTGIAHNMFLKYNLSNTQFEVVAGNTSSIDEGTNLYYTDARVASYLSSNDFDTATNIVASITDSAPGTLDTLNELAAALGDDANFSTTVTNSIATKLPLSGGTVTGNVTFGHNNKAIFGAGSDLSIFHNGSSSLIEDSGTGGLIIRSNLLTVQNAAGNETVAQFVEDGFVKLFYDNSPILATTSTGIDVTGTVTSDGLTVAGSTQLISGTNGGYTLFVDNSAGNAGSVKGVAKLGMSGWDSSTLNYPHAHIKAEESGVANYAGNLYLGTRGSESDVEPLDRLKVSSNGDISFYEATGTTAKFFWDASAESLGIGHSPSSGYKLDIEANNKRSRLLGTTGYVAFEVTNNGGSVTLGKENSSGGAFMPTAGAYDSFLLSQGSVNMVFGTNNTERMRIDSSGVVRIGGQTGTLKLGNDGTYHADIEWEYNNNELAFTTNNVGNFTFNSNGTERMRISSTGHVGIGTDNPNNVSGYRTLHIRGPNGSLIDIGASGFDSRIVSDTNGLGFEVTAGGHANQNIRWKAGTISGALDSHMLLNSSGNLGINKTSPSAKLHVVDGVSDTVAASNAVVKIDGTGGDGLAFGNTQSSPFSSWMQAGYLADGYSPAFNNGYPILINPIGGNVMIGSNVPNSYLHIDKRTTSTVSGRSQFQIRADGSGARAERIKRITYCYRPLYNQYTYHRIILGGGVYGAGQSIRYRVTFTTGHASGHGFVEGVLSVYAHHSTTKMHLTGNTKYVRHYSNGSYYGWTSNPDVDFFFSNQTNANACVIMRVQGHGNHNSNTFDLICDHHIDLEIHGSDANANTEMLFIGHSAPGDMGTVFSSSTLN